VIYNLGSIHISGPFQRYDKACFTTEKRDFLLQTEDVKNLLIS
jgi:hypothetical protein